MKVQLNFCKAYDIEPTSLLSQKFLRGVEVVIHSFCQDNPVKMASINYELIVDMDENDRCLELLHTNVRKYETDPNTLAVATKLVDRIRRKVWVL